MLNQEENHYDYSSKFESEKLKEVKPLKKRKGLRRLFFNIKYGIFNKQIEPEEFEIANEYISNNIDVFTLEKDLLLRGMTYKNVRRIIDAYNYLIWLTNTPEIKPVTVKQLLKGGILDGIRRS
jgi:hypothetical protein